jgi:hypothetical protein
MEFRIGFGLKPDSEAQRKRSKQMATRVADEHGWSRKKAAFSRIAAMQNLLLSTILHQGPSPEK